MSIQLSAEQERARTAILQWYRSSNRKPWFLLEGSAGTGKSSCITATTESIKGKVVYIAPTAKAALVMRRKGCPDPRTAHSAIYLPLGMSSSKELTSLLHKIVNAPTDELRAEVRPHLEKELQGLKDVFKDNLDNIPQRAKDLEQALRTNVSNAKQLLSGVNPLFERNPQSPIMEGAKLIVLDEVSMISKQLLQDILAFNVPVLAQGDFAQLPPIKANAFFNNTNPDFRLTQIHRQQADSPIIWLAHLAKEGKPLPIGRHGECIVTREPLLEEAMSAEQIIVGTHKTRWATNDKVRSILGFTSTLPEVGDKVICRHNNNKLGLINGDQFKITFFREGKIFHRIGIANEELSTTVDAHKEFFQRKEPDPWHKSQAECLDWSYAITGHLSQGSQYESVYVKDESRKFGADARKWLYTVCTRPVSKLVVRL